MNNTLRIQMLEKVIKACEEGRYCHGNGGDWWIVDTDGKTVITYWTAGNPCKEERLNADRSAKYLASTKPRKDSNTAKNLRDFIKTLK